MIFLTYIIGFGILEFYYDPMTAFSIIGLIAGTVMGSVVIGEKLAAVCNNQRPNKVD